MTTAGDFYDAIDRFAPFSTAESWDNVGLLVGGRELPVRKALLALDLTVPVLEEAVAAGAQLVITHHPVMMEPIAALTTDAMAWRAAAAGVSVLSAHTNWDLAPGGVNDALAERLGLASIRPFAEAAGSPWHKVVVFAPEDSAEAVYSVMAEAGAGRDGNYSHCGFLSRGEGRFLPLEGARPAIGQPGRLERVPEVRLEMLCPSHLLGAVLAAMKAAHPYEQPAFDVLESRSSAQGLSLGRIGDLPRPMTGGELALWVKEKLRAAGVRVVGAELPVSAVAVCGGSGGGLVKAAKGMGAQALVTGEAKHHQLLEAGERGLVLVEAGHFATEHVGMEPLLRQLVPLFPQVDLALAASSTDGAEYR